MKRFSTVALVLLTLLALTTGTVFAGTATSLSLRNDNGVPTFVFTVNGSFTKSELGDGYVQVSGGGTYKLSCNQTSDTTVICHSSKELTGLDVMVYFGGTKFWVSLPVEHQAPAPTPTKVT